MKIVNSSPKREVVAAIELDFYIILSDAENANWDNKRTVKEVFKTLTLYRDNSYITGFRNIAAGSNQIEATILFPALKKITVRIV